MTTRALQVFATCALLAAPAFAQCAPPSFTGPDGGLQPGVGIPGPDASSPVPGSDRGVPNPTPDPASTPDAGPKRGPTTPRGRGGSPIALTRGKSAKKRSVIQWTWPKPKGETALDYETTLAELRGDDPRPLLILREGSQYGRGLDKRLHKKLNSESLALLTRWFHCVRFSSQIMEKSHPWHALFSGRYPPQCFAVSWNGHDSEILSGAFSLRRLQRSFKSIIAVEYRKDVNKALRAWARILDKLDTLDSQEGNLRQNIELLAIEKGEKNSKLRKLRTRLSHLQKLRQSLAKKELAVLDLGLKRSIPKAGKSRLLRMIRGEG